MKSLKTEFTTTFISHTRRHTHAMTDREKFKQLKFLQVLRTNITSTVNFVFDVLMRHTRMLGTSYHFTEQVDTHGQCVFVCGGVGGGRSDG